MMVNVSRIKWIAGCTVSGGTRSTRRCELVKVRGRSVDLQAVFQLPARVYPRDVPGLMRTASSPPDTTLYSLSLARIIPAELCRAGAILQPLPITTVPDTSSSEDPMTGIARPNANFCI
jgi:hypothetical protein